MTATITPPPGVPGLGRTDPAVRLGDYERALEFYLGLPSTVVDRVVFADNSASDVTTLLALAERARAGKEVEVLSFDGLDYPVEFGRAFGETKLVETALDNSRLLGELADDELLWKLTGRLRFTNLARLVASAPAACDLYADFRRFPHRWVDLRVFACTPRAFRRLFAARADLLRESELGGFRSPEQVLYGELLGARDRWRIVPRLKVEPRIAGHAGFDGSDYDRPGRRAWMAARSAIRRVAPGLWI